MKTTAPTRLLMVAALAALSVPALGVAQVPYERILDAASEPGNWLTYLWNVWGSSLLDLGPD